MIKKTGEWKLQFIDNCENIEEDAAVISVRLKTDDGLSDVGIKAKSLEELSSALGIYFADILFKEATGKK